MKYLVTRIGYMLGSGLWQKLLKEKIGLLNIVIHRREVKAILTRQYGLRRIESRNQR